MANGQAEETGVAQKKDFFGHPRGLSTLFFTELWERFSYYGMRALLVLFMTAETVGHNPGLGFDVRKATAVYGLYTFFVYVLSLPGGWIADKLWGQRKTVFVGGCIIAAGHFTMAGPLVGLPNLPSFFGGLILIVLGTGLLKPNVSSIVGDLYPEGGARRDAGFSVFYMGINLGAILGPFLCGIFGEGYNWHWGFSLAGFGMLLGLISYKLGGKFLGDAGHLKTGESDEVLAKRSRRFWTVLSTIAALIIVFASLATAGVFHISLESLAEYLGLAAVIITIIFFGYIIFFGGHNTDEKKKLGVIFWLFILAALFWSGFEQAGSSMNLFAKDLTNRVFGPNSWLAGSGAIIITLVLAIPIGYAVYKVFKKEKLWSLAKWVIGITSAAILILLYWILTQIGGGWETPASTLQLINPTFIVIFAPIFGWLWTWLAARNANPSIPVKFALGLFGLAGGFFVLSWGASYATKANPVTPAWLVVTYFLHTCGELCLSPVGLSSMTKLAPKGRVSQMMGIWFVAAALGNLFAGLVAGQLETLAPTSLFWSVAMMIGGGGVIALLASPGVKKLMGDVE